MNDRDSKPQRALATWWWFLLAILLCAVPFSIASACRFYFDPHFPSSAAPAFRSLFIAGTRWEQLALLFTQTRLAQTVGWLAAVPLWLCLVCAVGLSFRRSSKDRRQGTARVARPIFWSVLVLHSWLLHAGLGVAALTVAVHTGASWAWECYLRTTVFFLAYWSARYLYSLFLVLWAIRQIVVPTALLPKNAAAWWCLGLGCVCYTITFASLANAQYEALLVPHGDSAMYEEHLYNFWQGKGFRSQIDNGRLFCGEHFQFIHLGLLPIYLLWPSLTTLHWCESAALASGAVAVAQIARRQGWDTWAAVGLGWVYLLYVPLHYLDLELTGKTFRPISFGVPLLLFAFLAYEARWQRLLGIGLALTLGVEETYCLPAALFGLYMACAGQFSTEPKRRSFRYFGWLVFLLAGCHFLFVLKIWLPYFRGGGNPHFVPYFHEFGNSVEEICWNLLTNPILVLLKLIEPSKWAFLLGLLLPLHFTPLLRWNAMGRLVGINGMIFVAIPTFAYLLLGSGTPPLDQFYFHFHAPLIPVLFWAAAGSFILSENPAHVHSKGPRLVLLLWLGLTTAFFLGKTPLGWKFYEPAEARPRSFHPLYGPSFEPIGCYWPDLYVPQTRAIRFQDVAKQIPQSWRIATTDYLRPRFTHHRAAHVYPEFRPHVRVKELDAILVDKMEGWWGRGPTNPTPALLNCLRLDTYAPVGTKVPIRCHPDEPLRDFVIQYHDDYFLLLVAAARE